MQLLIKYWGRVATWAGILLGVLVFVSLASGQPALEVVSHLPGWAGLAVSLAAFPAGIAISADALGDRRPDPRRVIVAGVAAASVVLLVFALGNMVAGSIGGESGSAVKEPRAMTLGELRAEVELAVERARSDGSLDRWRRANILTWHYVRRTDGAILPLLFGLMGIMVGYWARPFRVVGLRQAAYWSSGLFLLVSTYLAGENSYERIVLNSAGPAFFAGDLVLVVPALLVLGMGWPTAVSLWRTRSEAAAN